MAHALRHAHRRRLEAAATDRTAHDELAKERGDCRRALDARHSELLRPLFSRAGFDARPVALQAAMQTASSAYRSAAHMPAEQLLRGYGWFSRHMYHAHRGVRGIAAEAVVGIAHERGLASSHVQAALVKTVEGLRGALEADLSAAAPLRRTKAHLLLALGRLLPLYRAPAKAPGAHDAAATGALRTACIALLMRPAKSNKRTLREQL
eukprot:tig00021013_g17064.t1